VNYLNHISRLLLSLAFMVGVLGCESQPSTRLAESSVGSSTEMPGVELVFVSSDPEESPGSISSRIRVGGDGLVLMPADRSDPATMVVVDSTGELIAAFGPKGEGPNELQRALPFEMLSGGPLVVDLAKLRVLQFDSNGLVARQLELGGPTVIPVGMIDDTMMLVSVAGMQGFLPGTLDLGKGGLKLLLGKPDSVLSSFGGIMSAGPQPVFGRWANGFVVANGQEYRIALYDWEGHLIRILDRNVPAPRRSPEQAVAEFEEFRNAPPGRRSTPAELEIKRAELISEDLPHFLHLARLWPDYKSRLWVVGPAGDTAYADVFSDTMFLGRLSLPCKGIERGWAVNGRWLALSCQPDDPTFEGDAVLKLFRITEPD
jgi:hypothetical protein